MKPILLPLFFISSFSYGQSSLQRFTDLSLINLLKKQKAESGIVIVREIKTGNIVASSSLSLTTSKKNQVYINNPLLLSTSIEPGGLFLPIAAAFLIDNHGIQLSDTINLEGGQTTIEGVSIMDNENHGKKTATLNETIAISSNVGIAKLFYLKKDVIKGSVFIKSINQYVSSDINFPRQTNDEKKIPLYSYGYGFKMSPKEILNFYTQLAQNDTEMFQMEASRNKIKEILYNVSKNGTSKKLLSDTRLSIASKTATTLVLSKNGYNSKQYYSSIVGFAPIDNPMYSCIVIIKCKPNAEEFYGATVAGPLFKEIVQSLF